MFFYNPSYYRPQPSYTDELENYHLALARKRHEVALQREREGRRQAYLAAAQGFRSRRGWHHWMDADEALEDEKESESESEEDSSPTHCFENPRAEQPKAPHLSPDSQIPVPEPEPTLTPSPSLKELTAAAHILQSLWRARSQRKQAHSQITSLQSQFHTLHSSFRLPPSLSFAPLSTSSGAPPELLYTPQNKVVHEYENAATRLLTRLDGVESAGDTGVRRARKALVDEIESALREMEVGKTRVWEQMQQAPMMGPAQ